MGIPLPIQEGKQLTQAIEQQGITIVNGPGTPSHGHGYVQAQHPGTLPAKRAPGRDMAEDWQKSRI
ncbi:hypothetical protein HPB48_014577 [Haemaphysalis longicornis]|uniref:Uncharacterized protein n=1 Tax=Haemaphysalis longicornis TaxID=44386 RepID=A0A9J6GAZ3_HAELO|nr:hypothetical protein HPB48_014577 [Haemaphysalis longicornis]